METYVVVRVHGLLQHLLKAEDYEALLRGEALWSLPEYTSISPEDSVRDFLSKIDEVMIGRLTFLMKLQSAYTGLITAFADRLEVENLKVKLRELYSARGKYDVYSSYSHFIPLEKLLRAETEEELWELTRETPYQPEEKGILEGDLQLKEAYLDSRYYAYLKASVPRRERKALGELIHLEGLIPAVYWMIVLGSEKVAELIEKGILKGFKHPSVRKTSLGNYLATLRVRKEEAERLIEESEISVLMRVLRSNLLEILRGEARRAQLASQYLYYYLTLVKNERDNLQKIVIGQALGLDREKIRQTLVLPF